MQTGFFKFVFAAFTGCHGHSTAEANGNFVWSIQSRTSRSGHFSVQIDYQRQIRPQQQLESIRKFLFHLIYLTIQPDALEGSMKCVT